VQLAGCANHNHTLDKDAGLYLLKKLLAHRKGFLQEQQALNKSSNASKLRSTTTPISGSSAKEDQLDPCAATKKSAAAEDDGDGIPSPYSSCEGETVPSSKKRKIQKTQSLQQVRSSLRLRQVQTTASQQGMFLQTGWMPNLNPR
jgi:hypothetical protein